MQAPQEDSLKVPKKIVVFCGHPCGGKTYVSKIFRDSFSNSSSFEMDDLRTTQIPGQIHDKSRRDAAYRMMHHEATKALRVHPIIAVVATYFPTKARAEIAEIARRFHAELYIVQCVCDAQVAVDRFLRRLRDEPEHAGTDLSAARVRDLANQYERFDGGLTIETTNCPDQQVIHRILHTYILSGPPVDYYSWTRHWYSPLSRPQKPPSDAPGKLSRAIRERAERTLMLHGFANFIISAFLLLGGIPLLLYIFIRVTAEWPRRYHIFDSLWNGLVVSSWPDIATGATFTLAAAGSVGIYLAFSRDTREKRKQAKDIADMGRVPLYNLPYGANEIPSDREIYYAYQCRMEKAEQAKMPIAEIPIYFLVPPQQGKAFSVIAEKTTQQKEALETLLNFQTEAAEMALDWEGFAAGRWDDYSKNYAYMEKGVEKNLRCVGDPKLSNDGTLCIVPSLFCPYSDYAVRELSVNLCAPGTLPDMRRLFEGPAWDDEFLSLANLKDAAGRYSMRMSVTGLLLTKDNFFVLQRRSNSVASGVGSLGASVAGAADFRKDARGLRGFLRCPREWNLENSLLRELEEETGITEKHLLRHDKSGPFIGAAFNLRFGRDLNFYALLKTHLRSSEISAKRGSGRAHDSWEVEHIEFLHCKRVTVESIRSGELQGELPGGSRHLLGALYAWAVCQYGIR